MSAVDLVVDIRGIVAVERGGGLVGGAAVLVEHSIESWIGQQSVFGNSGGLGEDFFDGFFVDYGRR